MKRLVVSILTIVALTVSLVVLSVAPSAARGIPVPGANCIVSFTYWPDVDFTELVFSYNNMLFQTPIRRAGACGRVYVQSLGVATAGPCFIARIRTYNEDRTPNYDGPYMQWNAVGQVKDIRNGYITNNRLYRIFAVPCDVSLRTPAHPPGFHVYTHAG